MIWPASIFFSGTIAKTSMSARKILSYWTIFYGHIWAVRKYKTKMFKKLFSLIIFQLPKWNKLNSLRFRKERFTEIIFFLKSKEYVAEAKWCTTFPANDTRKKCEICSKLTNFKINEKGTSKRHAVNV